MFETTLYTLFLNFNSESQTIFPNIPIPFYNVLYAVATYNYKNISYIHNFCGTHRLA